MSKVRTVWKDIKDDLLDDISIYFIYLNLVGLKHFYDSPIQVSKGQVSKEPLDNETVLEVNAEQNSVHLMLIIKSIFVIKAIYFFGNVCRDIVPF